MSCVSQSLSILGAARPRVEWDGLTLGVWVSQAPVKGAANDAVLRAVATWSGRPQSAVRIVSGRSSRSKLVEIADDSTR